jgi:putative membrane protein
MSVRAPQPSIAPSSRARGLALPLIAIFATSALVLAFLIWLIYFHAASSSSAASFRFLPALEGVLNGLCAAALLAGFYFIRRGRVLAHRNAMITAFGLSVLFLVCYVAHHALHGDMHFAGTGAIRSVYLSILISHIVLSMVALPLILITFFFSLTKRFRQHRAIARYTLPIWLYVSVTGVVVYALLAAWS